MNEPSRLPTGTATFLFTDIEGSTRLLQQEGERYTDLLANHHRLLRQAFTVCGGVEVQTEGDAFFVVFPSAPKAVSACVDAQRALAANPWPDNAVIRVRMGLHTGEATLAGDNYVGLDVHRAARIASAGHGGQVLVSESVRALVDHSLPDGVTLRDLGEHRLKDLARPERLFQLDIAGLRTEFPPIRTLDNTPNNLPLQVTSFVGREHELEEARRLLSASRLLTLTGPGGTGKTRLSLQLAAEASDAFPDGTYFVRLAPIEDPELVPSTIAQTLGVQDPSAPEARLAEFLKAKKMLLVLDNFEQLLPAAPVVGRLLGDAPELKVIATSRAPLRVYGEQEYPVPPLGLPEPGAIDADSLTQFDAVRLFIDRAMAAKPDFRVTNENAPAVAAICARLDGLPLAIELAAARIRILNPQAMLPRLERTLEMLSSGARDLPARQQTLRGAIAWSYDLLDEGARRLFARFSVFVGGANLDDAERVCGPAEEIGGDVLDGLQRLVEQSVIRQADSDEPRFWMLVTIREFGREKLHESGEADAIRDRHQAVYADLARATEARVMGPEQKQALDRLQLDHDNLRAALDWLVEKCDGPAAMRMAASLWRFWQMRGHLHEGRRRFEQVLALPCVNDDEARLAALEAAGGICWWQGDLEATSAYYEEALAITRTLGDKARLANALYNVAFPMFMQPNEWEKAATVYEEALALYRELGDKQGIAKVLWGLGNVYYAFEPPHFEDAISSLAEAVAIFRELGDVFGLSWALHTYGLALMRGRHDFEQPPLLWREALDNFTKSGDVSGQVLLMDDFVQLAQEMGNRQRALRLEAAVSKLREATGTGLRDMLAKREWVPGPAGPEETKFWEDGRRMSKEDAIEYALQAVPVTSER